MQQLPQLRPHKSRPKIRMLRAVMIGDSDVRQRLLIVRQPLFEHSVRHFAVEPQRPQWLRLESEPRAVVCIPQPHGNGGQWPRPLVLNWPYNRFDEPLEALIVGQILGHVHVRLFLGHEWQPWQQQRPQPAIPNLLDTSIVVPNNLVVGSKLTNTFVIILFHRPLRASNGIHKLRMVLEMVLLLMLLPMVIPPLSVKITSIHSELLEVVFSYLVKLPDGYYDEW